MQKYLKNFKNRLQLSFFLLFFILYGMILSSNSITADEGMWLFTNPPTQKIKECYGYDLTTPFLEHLQKASIRFDNGGSGSFVSSQGLIMTNHHVAFSTLQQLSSLDHDYVANGFYAKTLEEELPCPNMELIVLLEIKDVTARIGQELAGKTNFTEREHLRRLAMNTIEQEAIQQLVDQGKIRDDYRCEVVSYYEGAICHLHVYKRLRDVRLVFAPEQSVGYFGGEPDNFEYPRYNLDVSFFRAYENGKPMTPPSFLPWSVKGAVDGELVFVSGHPARTNRFYTYAHLLFMRDYFYPYVLERVRRQEVLLQAYSEKGEKEKLQVASDLFRLRNTRKNRSGILLGLQTPSLMAVKQKFNDDTRKKITEQNILNFNENDPWKTITESLNTWMDLYANYDLVEENRAFDSSLYRWAKTLVRYMAEKEKPDELRFHEFRSSALKVVENQLLQEIHFDPNLEIIRLADSLGFYYEQNAIRKVQDLHIFDQGSPRELAVRLVTGTKLGDPNERKRLLTLDWKTLQQTDDPMIAFALKVDPYARNIRTEYVTKIADPIQQAYAAIANARFKTEGMNLYPDATFTLRLSYGKVAGYKDDNGTVIPPWTTFNGTYLHAKEHNNVIPYNLPERWLNQQKLVDPQTPMNFVSTNDIIGGNSGSPMVNGKGEVVGLIFDGNVQSLPCNFIYTEEQSRAVSVHSSAIREGVKKIYHADRIAEELGK